jgi:hypothetical protein
MSMFNLKTMRFAAFLAFATSAGPTWALITVDTSDAPGIEIDAEFPDDHVFKVPDGATVRLIKTPGTKNPNGDTHTIKGRYQGTLDDFIRRECWRADSDCGSSTQMGGTKGMRPADGGVRGVNPPE